MEIISFFYYPQKIQLKHSLYFNLLLQGLKGQISLKKCKPYVLQCIRKYGVAGDVIVDRKLFYLTRGGAKIVFRSPAQALFFCSSRRQKG